MFLNSILYHSLLEARTSILALRLIHSLLLLDRAVVVHKDKRLLVPRVDVALGALVPGTEVARRVVGGEGRLGRALLLSSVALDSVLYSFSCFLLRRTSSSRHLSMQGTGLLPRPLGPVRGHEDVGAPEGVVSPVGDVVEDALDHCSGAG